MTGRGTTTRLCAGCPHKGRGRMTAVRGRALLVPVTGKTSRGVGVGGNHILYRLARITWISCDPCSIMAGGTGPQAMELVDVVP